MGFGKSFRKVKRVLEYTNPTVLLGENLRRRYLPSKKLKGIFTKYLGGGSASFAYGNTASGYQPRSIAQLTTR